MTADRPYRTILNATSRARFMASMVDFAASPGGWKAKLLFGALMVLLFAINGLNVLSSYIGRDFMTAVASRDLATFTTQTIRYMLVLLLCTAAAAVFRYVEERLGLRWREFLTRRLVDLYVRRRFYHHLGNSHRIANPDQRIADDVRFFTSTTLSFLLMILNATLAAIAFSGVMWTISPLLFGVAVTYAVVGSTAMIWLGRPLVWKNYNQFDREAEFRADLVQLRENSEFVALAHHEHHFQARLNDRIDRLVRNYRKIISVNRNINFFSTGYNFYIQVIPVLIVAPMYIRGEIEFGAITQATIAFAQLLGAFSLIVTQFQSISSFTAVVARLDDFSAAARESETAPPPPIVVVEGSDGLCFDHVTLEAPDSGKVLVDDLTFTLPRGRRMLVIGPGEMAKMAFFRATADLWEHGRGRIERPAACNISFVPERPYLPPGSLRETLASGECAGPAIDLRIHEVLRALDLEEAVLRVGGLESERDWDDVFSLGELQRLAIARVLLVQPEFVVLDRVETTLEASCLQDVLRLLDQSRSSYVMIGRSDAELAHYDEVLELSGNGPWTLHPAKVIEAKRAANAIAEPATDVP